MIWSANIVFYVVQQIKPEEYGTILHNCLEPDVLHKILRTLRDFYLKWVFRGHAGLTMWSPYVKHQCCAGAKVRTSRWRCCAASPGWGASTWLSCSCHLQRKKVEFLWCALLHVNFSLLLIIDCVCCVLSFPQWSQTCLTSSTRLNWKHQSSRPYRRNMEFNAWIQTL